MGAGRRTGGGARVQGERGVTGHASGVGRRRWVVGLPRAVYEFWGRCASCSRVTCAAGARWRVCGIARGGARARGLTQARAGLGSVNELVGLGSRRNGEELVGAAPAPAAE